MLSVKKYLYTTTQYSSSCISNKTILRYVLNNKTGKTIDRRYGHIVPEKFLTTEKEVERHKLDPTVKKIRHQLVFSDYIEKKTLRIGAKQSYVKLAKLRKIAKNQRFQDLVEKPAVSIALKYMTDAKEVTEKTNEDNEFAAETVTAENMETPESNEAETKDDTLVFKIGGKPIHMPYAATDEYQTVEEITEIESKFVMPKINEKYRALYEKYLESKETDLDEKTIMKLLKDDKEKSQLSERELETQRPADDMSEVPLNWMTDYEQYNDDVVEDEAWKNHYGTPDPNTPVSNVPCGGCGALLQCQDPAIPGYLPSELFQKQSNKVLRSSTCQRCHFMKNYKITLDVKVKPKDYPTLLTHLKKKKAAVIMMVDLTDFPCSIWPGILDVIGKTTPVFVVGNKVDLLPSDGPNYLKRIEASLVRSLHDNGIGRANIKSVNLISAKTGYGVEQLINKLQKVWEYKGDVYMLGCTNVGKSSLFNALLKSDYCKVQAVDLIQRATISPWPGTTLNLLKFPILSPAPWRLYRRFQRLLAEQENASSEQMFRKDQFLDSKKLEHLTLQGRIGRTFHRKREEGPGFIGKDEKHNTSGLMGINETDEEYKNTRWFYDTPGTMHPDQILQFLTTNELMLTLPQKIISPRSFAIYRGHTLFLAGLGRLDHVGGYREMSCTVFASYNLPITICKTSIADEMYAQLIASEGFVVPINDPERLKVFPALKSKELTVTGLNENESAADVVLSSIGWLAITVKEGQEVTLQAWTPEGKGIHLRTPAMLPRSIALRGRRIVNSVAYQAGKRAYVKR